MGTFVRKCLKAEVEEKTIEGSLQSIQAVPIAERNV